MDRSLLGFSVCGILQLRKLEWLPCPLPGNLPDPGMEPASLTSPSLAGNVLWVLYHQCHLGSLRKSTENQRNHRVSGEPEGVGWERRGKTKMEDIAHLSRNKKLLRISTNTEFLK